MSFHEVRFPTNVALGALGGPERRTEVVTLASGFEERNALWAHSRRRFEAGTGIKTLNDLHEVIAFFEARMGRLHGFRWRDRADDRSGGPLDPIGPQDQAIGTGDGATAQFALTKRYVSGAETYDRPIVKPVAGTARVAVDGGELTEGVDFTVDTSTGLVTLTAAPSPGAAVTAGFAFDVPVRFDSDRLEIDLAAFEAGAIPSVPVVEIRL